MEEDNGIPITVTNSKMSKENMRAQQQIDDILAESQAILKKYRVKRNQVLRTYRKSSKQDEGEIDELKVTSKKKKKTRKVTKRNQLEPLPIDMKDFPDKEAVKDLFSELKKNKQLEESNNFLVKQKFKPIENSKNLKAPIFQKEASVLHCDDKYVCRSAILDLMKSQRQAEENFKQKLIMEKDKKSKAEMEAYFEKELRDYNSRLVKLLDLYNPNVHVEKISRSMECSSTFSSKSPPKTRLSPSKKKSSPSKKNEILSQKNVLLNPLHKDEINDLQFEEESSSILTSTGRKKVIVEPTTPSRNNENAPLNRNGKKNEPTSRRKQKATVNSNDTKVNDNIFPQKAEPEKKEEKRIDSAKKKNIIDQKYSDEIITSSTNSISISTPSSGLKYDLMASPNSKSLSPRFQSDEIKEVKVARNISAKGGHGKCKNNSSLRGSQMRSSQKDEPDKKTKISEQTNSIKIDSASDSQIDTSKKVHFDNKKEVQGSIQNSRAKRNLDNCSSSSSKRSQIKSSEKNERSKKKQAIDSEKSKEIVHDNVRCISSSSSSQNQTETSGKKQLGAELKLKVSNSNSSTKGDLKRCNTSSSSGRRQLGSSEAKQSKDVEKALLDSDEISESTEKCSSSFSQRIHIAASGEKKSDEKKLSLDSAQTSDNSEKCSSSANNNKAVVFEHSSMIKHDPDALNNSLSYSNDSPIKADDLNLNNSDMSMKLGHIDEPQLCRDENLPEMVTTNTETAKVSHHSSEVECSMSESMSSEIKKEDENNDDKLKDSSNQGDAFLEDMDISDDYVIKIGSGDENEETSPDEKVVTNGANCVELDGSVRNINDGSIEDKGGEADAIESILASSDGDASTCDEPSKSSINCLWIECDDGQGNTYYYNTSTEECQWEKPSNFDSDASSKVERGDALKDMMKAALEGKLKKGESLEMKKRVADAQAEIAATIAANYAQSGEQWIEVYDPSSDTFYYYETTSGSSTWEKPAEYIMAADDELMNAVIKIQSIFRARQARIKFSRRKSIT